METSAELLDALVVLADYVTELEAENARLRRRGRPPDGRRLTKEANGS